MNVGVHAYPRKRAMFGFMLYPIAGRIRSRSNREMSSPARGCASIYANHSLLRLICVITCVQLWTSVFCAKVFVKGITYTASVAKRSPTSFLIVFSTKGFLGSYFNAEKYASFFGAFLKLQVNKRELQCRAVESSRIINQPISQVTLDNS